MKLLAIETTGKQGTLAFADSEQILLTSSLAPHQRSTQSLVPAIRDALTQLHWDVVALTHVAVAVGPGSFTGLRVGITTARMIAYATGAEIIAVDTLQALATNIAFQDQPDLVIAAAMDAQRGDLSAGFFRPVSGSIPMPMVETELISVKDWWNKTAQYENILAVSPMLEKIAHDKPAHVRMAEPEKRFPHAEGVARVAWEKIRLGRQQEDIWTIRPFYVRLSAAEERKQNIQ